MFRSPPVDAIVILIIVLLVMGPKRLPAAMRGLGQGVREFKEGITGSSDDDKDKPALSESRPMPESTPSSPAEPTGQRESSAAGSERSS